MVAAATSTFVVVDGSEDAVHFFSPLASGVEIVKHCTYCSLLARGLNQSSRATTR